MSIVTLATMPERPRPRRTFAAMNAAIDSLTKQLQVAYLDHCLQRQQLYRQGDEIRRYGDQMQALKAENKQLRRRIVALEAP